MSWRKTVLSKISSFGPQYGANAKAVNSSGLRPRYVRITDIDPHGRLLENNNVEANIEDYSSFLLQDGDLLFARSGNTVGKTYRYRRKDGPCIFAGYLIRFRINPDLADSRFVFYFTQSPNYKLWVNNKKRVAGQPNINGKEYSTLDLPFFPLSEQRRVVEILEQADALRMLRADADQKAADILPALFYKMFGDPATNSKGWPIALLGDLGELDRGKSRHRPRNAPELLGGPYPFIQTGDVANSHGYIRDYSSTYSELGLSQSKMWQSGTLCITIAANIASSGILAFDACFPDSVVGFTPGPDINTAYVHVLLLFLKPILERSAPQVAQKNINLKILRELPTPVPPKDLLDTFKIQHEKVLRLGEKRYQSTRNLEQLWNTLLYQAFKGDLTAKWREAHMKELLKEMEVQSKVLAEAKANGSTCCRRRKVVS